MSAAVAGAAAAYSWRVRSAKSEGQVHFCCMNCRATRLLLVPTPPCHITSLLHPAKHQTRLRFMCILFMLKLVPAFFLNPSCVQYWLGHVGSPASTIERLEILEERKIDALEYDCMMRRPNVP